jgi:hypothetical protein
MNNPYGAVHHSVGEKLGALVIMAIAAALIAFPVIGVLACWRASL